MNKHARVFDKYSSNHCSSYHFKYNSVIMYFEVLILFGAVIAQIRAEQCLTPNNETAQCIPLYSCRVLIAALASQEQVSIKFVSESNCGGTPKIPLVCCGTTSNFTTAKDSGTEENTRESKIKLLPSSKYCGYQHADDYFRNNDDTTIRITEFPWSARIKFATPSSKNNYLCVGSLINRRYVLTAAHCVHNLEGYQIEAVELGEYNVKNKTDCVQEPPFEEECSEPIQEIPVEKIIPHPGFRKLTGQHDIALIRLRNNVTYSDYIRPICLPLPERVSAQVGDTLVSTGWGRTSINKDFVEVKKKIISHLIANDECLKLYQKAGKEITENQLCASPFSNSTDVGCQGDSGGPLMFSHSNQWQQEGILSFGKGCNSEYPDGYTNVKKYLEWILYVIEP